MNYFNDDGIHEPEREPESKGFPKWVLLVGALLLVVVGAGVLLLPATKEDGPPPTPTVAPAPSPLPSTSPYGKTKVREVAVALALLLDGGDFSAADEVVSSHELATGCQFQGWVGLYTSGDLVDPKVRADARDWFTSRPDNITAVLVRGGDTWLIVEQVC